MLDQFSRTRLLLGQAGMDQLAAARVAVFGLGGVGGHTAEALARSGIGALDLIDNDVITLTNLNRQLLATHSTLGMPKVEAARIRVLDINPALVVATHQTFYGPETASQFDFTQYDYIVDAIDTMTGKLALVERAQQTGTPIISAMGAGNKLNPTTFEVADIYQTTMCPLARIFRKELRKRGIRGLKVVYSQEPPMTPVGNEEPPAPGSSRHQTPGSTAFVPPVAGLILAGEVVRALSGVDHLAQ